MAGKNRTFRTDVLTHPSTAGLQSIDRDILFFQVVASNIAGVMRKSVAQIAKDCGKGASAAKVRASLKRMQDRAEPLIRWWPELEIVWACSAAKHQGRTPNGWKGVVNAVEVLPAEVRAAFWERYSGRKGDPALEGPSEGEGEGPPEGPTEGVAHTGTRNKERGTRNKKGSGGSPKSRARSASPPKTRADIEADRRHALSRFRELVAYDPECRPTPPGRSQLGQLIVGDKTMLSLLEQGATVEELHTVAKNLARRIGSGELPADMWGGISFSWPYPMLRDGLPVPNRSKPGLAPSSGPKLETAAEAEAYAKDHGGSLTGTGWGWELDGRGGQRAVRIGGAA
ncbi:MAG: hypothetical protein ACRBN8_22570 [Nannocystales bacterium]